ncbi:MAG TPA: hypothetical protein VIJ12_05645, partial [Candidatus Baltobacteraceae bacterium]
MKFSQQRLAFILVVLAAGCSSAGSGLHAPAPLQMSMPKSISPASIHAAPMAKTAILAPGAMAVRPQGAIQGANWSQIPGSASSAAAAADGSLWVLSTAPSGPDKYIWHYAGGNWTNISGMASEIAVAPNGTLYAINSGGGAYSYSGGAWTVLGGGSSAITTAADGSFYVLSNGNGAGSDQAIWHNVGGTWAQVPGAGVAIAGSFDTGSYTLSGGTVAPGGLYVVNAQGTIYYENTNASFVQLPANASALAPTAVGGVFALGYPANAGGSNLYYFDLNAQTWSMQSGAGGSISSNDGTLYAIGSNGAIYSTPVQSAAPTPTPPSGEATAFPTPNSTPNLTESCDTSSQRCGVQRWHTKTLDDVNENLVNWTPQLMTVTQLNNVPVPTGFNDNGPGGSDNGRYAPYEDQVYTVQALLVTRKHETGSSGDDDYHVEI